LKVVHLIPEDGLGGAETAAREMACRDDLPCEFHLVSMAGKSFAPHRPNTHALGYSSALDPRAQFAAARACLRLDPDVLICSLWKTIPAAILVKLRRPRIKLVAFFHSSERVHLVDRVMHAALLARADAAWADGEVALTDARTHHPRIPGRIISFVIDPVGHRYRTKPPRPRFISWSRIHQHKGIDRSIELIARLNARGIDAALDLWGPDQGLRAELERQARQSGVGRQVRFHGPTSRDRIPDLAEGASFLLQLSRQEGMAMVVVEAMQLGLVPVVTPVGEIRRYCRDGENALLVDPADLETAAGKIERLLQDPAAYARMSNAARKQWEDCPLYADDVCAAACELIGQGR
jgi:glycosyltransferase involved in cell wall biosynthesis